MESSRIREMEAVPAAGAHVEVPQASPDPKLRVTVVNTTHDGTVAALKAAADLARHLGADIVLLAPHVVPIQISLDRPHVAIEILKRRYIDLVAEAEIIDEQIAIRILLCRNRVEALKQTLAPHSLIVIGGSSQWWRIRERRLARRLQKMGHHVVFVDSAVKDRAEPQSDGLRLAAVYRVIEKESRAPNR